MILFVIYAAAVWLVVFAQRRRPLGFIIAIAAPLPAAALGLLLQRSHDTLTIWSMAVFAFAGLLAFIALFLAVQPRRSPHACDACGYDLFGVRSDICPECGNGASFTHTHAHAPAALSPRQADALRARRDRARWSAPDSPSTRSTPTPAAMPADVHADAS